MLATLSPFAETILFTVAFACGIAVALIGNALFGDRYTTPTEKEPMPNSSPESCICGECKHVSKTISGGIYHQLEKHTKERNQMSEQTKWVHHPAGRDSFGVTYNEFWQRGHEITNVDPQGSDVLPKSCNPKTETPTMDAKTPDAPTPIEMEISIVRLRQLATDYREEYLYLLNKHNKLETELTECQQQLDQARAAVMERVAILTAHRACGNQEQDPQNGKLAGYCVICQVPWPCDFAKPKEPLKGNASAEASRGEYVKAGEHYPGCPHLTGAPVCTCGGRCG